MLFRWIVVLIAAGLSSGCVFMQATLDVGLDAASARRGPISSVEAKVLDLAELQDVRVDRKRIGSKRSGYGTESADIKTGAPVTEIVRDAVQKSLEKNGHRVAPGSPLRIEGEVTQFWFDQQVNLGTTEFMGTVECKLRFSDAAAGTSFYSATYTGHYNEKSAGGYSKSWQRVMNRAVASMAESIVADEQLAAALKAAR